MTAKAIVTKKAPTKPSTVFLGLSLMSWWRPNIIPASQPQSAAALLVTEEAPTANVGRDIVHDDQRRGNPEPDETLRREIRRLPLEEG